MCILIHRGGGYVEIRTNIEFIGEYDGVYMYWVSWNGGGKMIQLTEEDLEDDDP